MLQGQGARETYPTLLCQVLSHAAVRASVPVRDRRRNEHPGEAPRRDNLGEATSRTPPAPGARTHAHCSQHEGRGSDQVNSSPEPLPSFPGGLSSHPAVLGAQRDGVSVKPCWALPSYGLQEEVSTSGYRPSVLSPKLALLSVFRLRDLGLLWIHFPLPQVATCWTFKCFHGVIVTAAADCPQFTLPPLVPPGCSWFLVLQDN